MAEVDVENAGDLAVVAGSRGNDLDSEGTEKGCVDSEIFRQMTNQRGRGLDN